MVGGLLLAAAGMACTAALSQPDRPYSQLLVPLLVWGIGNSMVFPAAQSAVVGSVPESAMGQAPPDSPPRSPFARASRSPGR